jgi:hypothetical protein
MTYRHLSAGKVIPCLTGHERFTKGSLAFLLAFFLALFEPVHIDRILRQHTKAEIWCRHISLASLAATL